MRTLRAAEMLTAVVWLAVFAGRTHAGTSYWNRFDAPARDFNDAANWVGGVPGPSDTAAFTNWGNNFTLVWSAPTVSSDAVFDAVNLTREVRPGGTGGSAVWTVTNSMRVGNSVANLAGMQINAQQIAVTNSGGTAALYVNWGTPGRGRIYQWKQNASLIADHIYASNHYAWAGLDVINLGTLTTRGDSEFAILTPATPTTFYMANWVGALATWNILGGTSKMAQDMNLGHPGVYGWGTGASTAMVSVAGSTARLLAARSMNVGASGAGVGLLTVSNGGYAQVSGLLRVGLSSGSMGNTIKVTGPNSKLKTASQTWIYSYQPDNSVQIENGGTWEHNTLSSIYLVGAGSSTNNRVVIDGPGSSFVNWDDIFVGGGGGVQSGRGWLVVRNGATASSASYANVEVGYGTGSTYGEIRVEGAGSAFMHPAGNFNVGVNGTGTVYVVDGGMLESVITVGANGKGLVMNNGGILQFAAIDPTITVNTPGRLVVTNGTISFRGVTTVNVNGNLSGTRLINATFYGANAFRLNSATNAATGQTYTFNVTGDPRNYARLELLNGSMYRGGAVTIGSSGTLMVTNGLSTVSGDLTFQSGATFAVHAPTNTASAALTVGGAVALGGATLQVTLDAPPVEGEAYILIANPGTAPVAGLGTFSAPTVDVVCAGQTYTMAVRFRAGDGNDVAVTLASKKGTLLTIR